MEQNLIKNDSQKLYSERTLKRLVAAAFIMYAWILVWGLVFKCGRESQLVLNYYNLRNMTIKDRILWDLIPFNYRGEEYYVKLQIMNTVLNCFVLAPFGIAFQYLFKKTNLLRDGALCLCFALFIESVQILTPFANPATEDILTNTFSCFIGIAAYFLILKRLSLKWSVRLMLAFVCIFGVVTVYSIVNMVSEAELIFRLLARTY